MIEKLSDEMIKNEFIKRFKETGSFCDFCNRWEESAKFVRDYYDKQIEAHAKTMDELWEMFDCGPVSEKAIEYINKWSGHHKRDTVIFGYAVDFFLAAGGRVKE